MREAIGGTWITQLVIIFMLIFVAFLALSLNYSKAFQVRNEILTMIEKREGVTTGSNINKSTIKLINNYLSNNGYNVKGNCEKNSYGVSNLTASDATIEKVTNNKKEYYYCISKLKSESTLHKGKVYYKVNIFFYFNLPVIGEIFKFNINGTTNDIVVPADKLQLMG